MATTAAETKTGLRAFFSFPHPVNEYAARSVAAMTFLLGLAIIVFDIRWLTFFMVYSFLAHVLAGPRLSIIGSLATRVIAPKVLRHHKPVAGPPKQFAQTIGLALSSIALVLMYGFGEVGIAKAVLGTIVVFAALEAALAFCAGCLVFGFLMKWGFIPPETCERCNNLSIWNQQRQP
ncbi:MAG: DUF4395 domain-containing protein [SAR202 cluster bacterium]|nr:DUF4395 domain-containing protein [SAR202 cluster bacterium]